MRFVEDYLKVKPTDLSPMAGRLLVSVPFYNDPFFNRTVVLLTDYEKTGSAGLVLNKPSAYPVRKLVSDIKIDDPMYVGGPVMTSRFFCIHNHEHSESGEKLLPGIYIGYNELFLALIEHQAIQNLQYRFFLGYSGWAEGQLESEIENKMWVVMNANPELVFETPAEILWEKVILQLGESYTHWLDIPKDITDN